MLPFGVLLFILLALLIRVIRPTFVEIMFFIFITLWPALSALMGLPDLRNYLALIWFLVVLIYLYLAACNRRVDESPISAEYAPFFIVFSILLIISTFANPLNDRSLQYLIQTLPLVIMYWSISRFMQGQNIDRLLIAILLGAVVNALVFLAAFSGETAMVTIEGLAYGAMRPTILGVGANAWPFPSMNGLMILLALVIHRSNIGRKEWFWIVPTAALLLGQAILNMSRSVLLGILVGLLFILATHPKGRKLMVASIVTLGVVFISSLPFILPRIEMMLRFRTGLSGRGEIWQMAWRIIEDHPVLGIGPANFGERFLFESPLMRDGLTRIATEPTAHNIFLHLGVEIGIPAALLALSLIAFFTYRSWKIWPILKHTPYFSALVAVSAMIVSGFVRSFFETDLIFMHGNLNKNLTLILMLAIQDHLAAKSTTLQE